MAELCLGDPQSPPGLDPRRWYALCLLCLAFFVDVFGSTSVFAAGPALGRALGLSQAGLQWSFTAATLPAGALLLMGGRFADLFGRRRMFMLGLGLLVLASLACGWAPSAAALIGARAAQGASAALLMPAALSLLMNTFRDDRERNKALAAWSVIGGTGATAGLLLGGLVTSGFGWQWVFFINAPLGVVMLLLSPVLLREPIMTVSSVGAAYIAERAIARFGPRPVAVSGLALLALTCLSFAAAATGGGPPLTLMVIMLLFGLGMGCAYVAGTVASLKDVSEQDSGIAAGLQNISFGLGTTLGVAALSTVAAATTRHLLSHPGSPGHTAALTSGYRAAFIVASLFAAFGLAATFIRSQPSRAPDALWAARQQ